MASTSLSTSLNSRSSLLHGGLLGGMGGEAAGVDVSREGAWTLATPTEGFLAASYPRQRFQRTATTYEHATSPGYEFP
eukprot:COSAG02_NODE_38838_length_424_cov_0.812308_2_plen_77_part_01